MKLNYYILLLLFSTLFLYGCSGFFDSTEQKQAIDFDKNLKPILVELDLSKNELNSFNDITTLKLNIENNRNDNSLVYITIPDVPIMSKSKNFKNEYEVNLYGKTDENYIPLFEYGERIEDLTFGSLAFGIGEYMDDLDTDLIAHVCTKYKDEIYAFVCVNEDVCGKSSISNFKQKIGGPIDIKNIEFINHFSSSTTGVLEISMHFQNNAQLRVFLISLKAGGTGLNLQAADCVINFELPWNPAKLNQRIGRVSRIGQKSKSINVVNLISKYSIEERILAGIQMKTDLFEGVFEDGADVVEFSKKKRDELLDQLKQMMGDDIPTGTSAPAEEIPEDTPHFLNPDVLNPSTETFEEDQEIADSAETSNEEGNLFANQPVEKVEEVLNNGLSFIGGLLEMATGQKLEHSANETKMINIDQESGEVTMKFKLPGF